MFAKKIEHELSIKDGVMLVDETSCDGCGSCIYVCPQSAIHVKTLTIEELKKLSFKGWIKVKIKGNKKAFINRDLCTNCGLCMKECHEFAIHRVKQEIV